MSIASTRLSIRLARRDLRRRPWRTVLVVVMVMIPCAAMTLGIAALRSSEWSAIDELQATSGQADALAFVDDPDYEWSGPPPITAESLATLEAGLPDGSRVIVADVYQDRVRTEDDRTYFEVSTLDLGDPMTEGVVAGHTGALTPGPGEAVITDALARRLDVGVGDTVQPERWGEELLVSGIVVPSGYRYEILYVADTDGRYEEEMPLVRNAYIDLPGRPFLDAAATGATSTLSIDGWTIEGLAPWSTTTATVGVFWTYVMGGVGLVVLGTVITAAFAISARRQLHTIGLLSATGAAPDTVRRFLVTQGVLTGTIGALAGIGLVLLAGRLVPAHLRDALAGRHVEAIAAPPLDLLPILLLGAVGAGAAAALPARSIAVIPALQALAGRRPLPAVHRRLPVAGAASLLMGAACFAMAVAGAANAGSSLWAVVAVTGALLTLAGVCMIAPWAVARLEPLSARWPRSWRLASRSLTRNRVRSSAVIGAICAVVATLVAGSTLYASSNEPCCEDEVPYSRDDQLVLESWRFVEVDPDVDVNGPPEPDSYPIPVEPEVLARVEAILPEARRIPLPHFTQGGDGVDITTAPSRDLIGRFVADEDGSLPPESEGAANPTIGVATTELLDFFEVPEDLRRQIADGDAVALTDFPSATSAVEVTPASVPVEGSPAVGTGGAAQQIEVAGTFESPHTTLLLPTMLISEERAFELGYATDIDPTRLLLALDDPMSSEQIHDLTLLSGDLSWEAAYRLEGSSTSFPVPSQPSMSRELVRAAVLGSVFLLVLLVVSVGLALAAKDSEDERQVLAAVGASPRTLRRVGALRGVLLVTTAVVLALPAGLLPAAAIHAASRNVTSLGEQPLAVDLTVLAFLVAVLPVTVGLLVWFAGSLRDLARPARPDVFAFAE